VAGDRPRPGVAAAVAAVVAAAAPGSAANGFEDRARAASAGKFSDARDDGTVEGTAREKGFVPPAGVGPAASAAVRAEAAAEKGLPAAAAAAASGAALSRNAADGEVLWAGGNANGFLCFTERGDTSPLDILLLRGAPPGGLHSRPEAARGESSDGATASATSMGEAAVGANACELVDDAKGLSDWGCGPPLSES
jgi:hypothetical protein